ncbi:MAG: PBSX family phage terminase large subunit [Desulfobulbaceae bacterium]|nr:PBSX family phage terminase large subunit [Desulfobulbaceae bacterium]
MQITTDLEIIPAFQPLFDPDHKHYKTRYKVPYGGRYSAKSTQCARGVLVRGHRSPELVLCAREVQKSIDDSVKRLLDQEIKKLGLQYFYESRQTYIKGRNGTEIIFDGLKEYTSDTIKSKEGVTLCWVEEANAVSQRSWDILIPTIRAEGSEIWASFNPELETDPVWRMFVARMRDDVYAVRVNWYDLPSHWLTSTIISEINDLKKNDYDRYLHVYGGECRQYSDDILIPPALIRRASDAQDVHVYPGTPLTMAVDPARLGNDRIVVSHKIGRNITKIHRYPRQRIDETSAQLMHEIDNKKPVKCYIDCGGLGVGIYDNLVGAGYGDIAVKVDFGGASSNPDRWENKRAEMYELFLQWLEDAPNSIRADAQTIDQLCLEAAAVRKEWKKNRIMSLISKEAIKKELGYSPDNLDSLVLHFAYPIAPGEMFAKASQRYQSFQANIGFSVI